MSRERLPMEGSTVQPLEADPRARPPMGAHPLRALPSCGAGSRPPGLPPISRPVLQRPRLRGSHSAPSPHLDTTLRSRAGPASGHPVQHPPPQPGPRPIRTSIPQHPVLCMVQPSTGANSRLRRPHLVWVFRACAPSQSRLNCEIARSKVAVAY